ncbi:MAG: flavodoxin family protein [Desulfatitalea sp.]|nr:flavodoxin family protein [Desulfatitalea sp.]NNK02214.1 flavodoxin family protein [Desulfatitalea sp.]
MKVLGLCCGRKMGNGEVLVKAALMGAEQLDAQVEIVRLLDLDMKHCTACGACMSMLMRGKDPQCVLKDDLSFLWNKIKDCDGLIIGAPIYALSPPGYISVFRDRVSAQNAVAFLREYKKRMGDKAEFDPRIFNKRVGGLISVGGAETLNWTALGIPTLYTIVFPLDIKIVDHMQVLKAGDRGSVTLQGDTMKKARNLGKNLVQAYQQPADEITFLGQPGLCPVCHCNLIQPGQKFQVECAVCAAGGTLKIEGEKLTMVIDPESMKECRLTEKGMLYHLYEIIRVSQDEMRQKDEIEQNVEKYRSYKSYALPLHP